VSNRRKLPRPRVEHQQGDAFWWIEQGLAQRQAAEGTIAEGVASARQSGVSYARIGAVMGMTAEGVRRKYPGRTTSEILAPFAPKRDPHEGFDDLTDVERDL